MLGSMDAEYELEWTSIYVTFQCRRMKKFRPWERGCCADSRAIKVFPRFGAFACEFRRGKMRTFWREALIWWFKVLPRTYGC